MTAGPVLTTARLLLRPPAPEDLDGFATFEADEETTRYLGGVKSRAEAWRILATLAGAWALQGYGMFSVVERATGRWVGRIGPWCPEGWPGTEVGWGVLPEFAGKGYAFEGAVAAIDFAVDLLGWADICHVISPHNARSIALAQRLGSVNRGQTRLPPPIEAAVDLWGQSADDWRTRRRA